MDLSKSYDLGQTGDYTVSFASFLDGARTGHGQRLSGSNGRMASLQSVALKLWIDADNALGGLKGGVTAQAKPGGTVTVVNGVSYVGCSSTQITGAGAAVSQARTYSENGKGYLAGNNQGPRYTTWFGAYLNYGQTGAANLPISNPDNAVNDADNHEYFAENSPNKN